MLGQQLSTILARTDPFDLAQGVERHVQALSAPEVRDLIVAAAPRMNDSYRAEFLPLVDEIDGERLKRAFTHSLKTNLRAIPLFGVPFCEDVISHIPGDRAIGLDEESRPVRKWRPAAAVIAAVALLLAGAAAQRVLSTARVNAEGPVLLGTPAPVALRAPAPVAVHAPPAVRRRSDGHRVRRAVPQRISTVVAAPIPVPAPPSPARRTLAPGAGVKTVVVVPSTPAPTPPPAPIDVSDMPRAYTDATPLPKDASPPPAQVSTRIRLATPTPAPKHSSWLHRTIMHIDPFKPHAQSTPSQIGPQQP